MIEAETLARLMSEKVRERRLRRIGEDPAAPCVAWEDMPEAERRSWIDAAEAALEALAELRRRG